MGSVLAEDRLQLVAEYLAADHLLSEPQNRVLKQFDDGLMVRYSVNGHDPAPAVAVVQPLAGTTSRELIGGRGAGR